MCFYLVLNVTFLFSVTKRIMCPKRERMVSQEVDQEVGVEQGKTPSLAVLLLVSTFEFYT